MTRSPQPATVKQSVLTGGATLFTLEGARAGPTVALLGGVHGDEDEGVLAVHRLIQELAEAPLVGTLRAVAPTHAAAWAAHSRVSPVDGLDLARCFPGDRAGSGTPLLAATITEEVIDGADLLIDLHSAGTRYSMPLFCGFTRDSSAAEPSRQAAISFGAPLVWEHPWTPPGRTLSVARERGMPAIYAECSGGGSIHADDLDAYVRGVHSVLGSLGMTSSPSSSPRSKPAQRVVYGGGDLDAAVQAANAGLFVTATAAGTLVEQGEELGQIYDDLGRLVEQVVSQRNGIVMFLRRHARIEYGDVLFALADTEKAD